MFDKDEARLTHADLEWLADLDKRYDKSGKYVGVGIQRADLIARLREKLRADYVIWVMMQGDVKTNEGATLEFFDDAPCDTVEEKELWWRRARIIHKMNVTNTVNGIYNPLTEDHPHVTVTKGHLERRRPRLKLTIRDAFDLATTSLLAKEWESSGMNEFMLLLYRLDKRDGDLSYGSGIGVHRTFGRPAFTPREERLLHTVSLRHQWLHAFSINPAYPVAKIKKKEHRILFPFLFRNYTVGEISAILGWTNKKIEHQIEAIARKIGLDEEHLHRNDICDYFKLHKPPEGSDDDPTADWRKGLESLEEGGDEDGDGDEDGEEDGEEDGDESDDE